MRLILFILLLCQCTTALFSQKTIRGIVADSITRKILPFATVRPENRQTALIAGINGQFSFSALTSTRILYVSHINYTSRTVPVDSLLTNDTIFLAPAVQVLSEVVVKPQTDKVRRIINTAIRNKPQHNPEMYEAYQCHVYYKMWTDLKRSRLSPEDSAKRMKFLKKPKDTAIHKPDSTKGILGRHSHAIFSETFSKRSYKRPQHLQETIIASRFSGLKKTYFSNLESYVIPFHVYSDYITLNGKSYINPLSKGWQRNYSFYLADEIHDDKDTIFIFSFAPKQGAGFNSLRGLVYINSDGYAISHFTGSAGDTSTGREIRIEQIYHRVHEKWFPRELNYNVIYGQYIFPGMSMEINGHSVIDSVAFTLPGNFRFDKSRPVKLGDSVDLHTEKEWSRIRMDTITTKERNTYRVMDSLFQKKKIEPIIAGVGKMVIGRLPVGKFDIDVTRLLAFNDYEKVRTGIGLFTSEKLSKHYTIGGWGGYGWKDKKMKYGFSGTVFLKGNTDNWLRLFYNNDYQNAGNVNIHPDIDRIGYRKWLLVTPDQVKEWGAMAHTQAGYWQLEASAKRQELAALYQNNFLYDGKNYSQFTAQEAGLGLRFAYGEKRAPIFGYYFPAAAPKYPIFYLRGALGKAESGSYSTNYARVLAAVTFNKHINRWGRDEFRIEAGMVHSFDDKPFSRSFLLASKGFRRDERSYYARGGFLTMRPFDYYSDRYFSFMYKHDLDKFLWQLKFSKPYISIAHNLMYGTLRKETMAANSDIKAPISGYHESGLIFNQILQMNFFHTSYIYVNAGAFYHWSSSFNKKDLVWLVGLSAGF